MIGNEPLVNYKANKSSETKRLLIISHWDLDHYSVIQSFADEELDLFDKVVVPEAHTSKTSVEVIKWMSKILGDKLCCIKQSPRAAGGVHIIKEPPLFPDLSSSKINVGLYKTSYSQSRNNGGLILIIKIANTLLMFSGDHHYLSLKRCLEYINLESIEEMAVVVPHHGGLAGSLDDFLNEIRLNQINTTWYLSAGVDHESLCKILYEGEEITLNKWHPRKSVMDSIRLPVLKTLDVKSNTYLSEEGRHLKIRVNQDGEIKNSKLSLNILENTPI
ncbi:hypothetical protein [Exiguobacterium alkaliphilum]|uniref:hypothetical protein n=1 Tax=Exiguobacterium alkaliphilum TaxID=1428684 RepID=UPI0005524EAE|nr:hypothetical protein [Exiguobacterium alkaliphilum]